MKKDNIEKGKKVNEKRRTIKTKKDGDEEEK